MQKFIKEDVRYLVEPRQEAVAMRDVLPVPDVPGVDPALAVTHVASVGAMVAAFMGWLPAILAIIPAVYYVLLIWESKTVQEWVSRRREKKRLKDLAALKAKSIVIAAQIDAAAEVKVARVYAAAKVDNAAVDAQTLVAKTVAGLTGPVA